MKANEITNVPAVYTAISRVAARIAKEGIAKERSNPQQGYSFRGIDDVYNALAPILSAEGLCVLPSVSERTVVERTNAKGTALFYVTVRCDFSFVAAVDGSTHIVTTYGEAMDSGDKATNKAMSAAYKYACLQAFCIPVEGNDTESEDHEVRSVWDIDALLKGIEGAPTYLDAKAAYAAATKEAVKRKDLGAAKAFKEVLLSRADVPPTKKDQA